MTVFYKPEQLKYTYNICKKDWYGGIYGSW